MTMRLGSETGSVINHIMSGDQSRPVKGEGATILHWSDRHAYTVTEVAANGKRATIQRDKATRTDGLGMSDAQQYSFERWSEAPKEEIRFAWGKWRYVHGNSVVNIIFGVRQEYYDFSF